MCLLSALAENPMKKPTKKTPATFQEKAAAALAFIAELKPRAEELWDIRNSLRMREEKYKIETDSLFKREAELKQQLMEGMKAAGQTSIKVQSGDTVSITVAKALEVSSEIQLLRFAIDNKFVSPRKDMVITYLKNLAKEGKELPSFARLVERESISVKKPTPKVEKTKATEE